MALLYTLIPGIIFLGDLNIKNRIEESLQEGECRPKAGGRILIRKHHNEGAMLNMGEKRRGLVALLSLLLTLAALVLFVLSLGNKGNTLLRLGLSLLLGGAFSNTYDRLKRKYVVDYLSFGVKWKRLRGVVFNLSDFCIMTGAMLTALGA